MTALEGRGKLIVEYLKHRPLNNAGMGPSCRQIADGIAQEKAILLSQDAVYYELKKLMALGIVGRAESRKSVNGKEKGDEYFIIGPKRNL